MMNVILQVRAKQLLSHADVVYLNLLTYFFYSQKTNPMALAKMGFMLCIIYNNYINVK